MNVCVIQYLLIQNKPYNIHALAESVSIMVSERFLQIGSVLAIRPIND